MIRSLEPEAIKDLLQSSYNFSSALNGTTFEHDPMCHIVQGNGKKVGCYMSKIDQTTAFWAIFGQKTGYKLQYVVKIGGQNKVIIAKKSNIIHHFEIVQKTAFFSTRIMAPVCNIQKKANPGLA